MKSKKEEAVELIASRLERMEGKIDRLDDRLDSAEKIAIKQEANLEAHMRRSDLLEQSQGEVIEAIKPVLKVYTVAWGITKIVGALSIVAGIVSKLAGVI